MPDLVSNRRFAAWLILLPVVLLAGTPDHAANLLACKNGLSSCDQSRLTRLERLKAVASSPASFANPDGVKPWRAARASIESQIALCESIRAQFEGKLSHFRTSVLCIMPRVEARNALCPKLAIEIPGCLTCEFDTRHLGD